MRLCELNEKQSAVIKTISASQEAAMHLRDRGFCEGEQVLCLKKAALGSPVLYLVKGTQMALRTADAACIEVLV